MHSTHAAHLWKLFKLRVALEIVEPFVMLVRRGGKTNMGYAREPLKPRFLVHC